MLQNVALCGNGLKDDKTFALCKLKAIANKCIIVTHVVQFFFDWVEKKKEKMLVNSIFSSSRDVVISLFASLLTLHHIILTFNDPENHTIPTFNDPEKGTFSKHCGKRKKRW